MPLGILKASPSCVLVHTPVKNILIDPGTNSELLLSALNEARLKPQNIDMIFLTHYHPDHILNIQLFPGKEILDGSLRYIKDAEVPYSDFIPETDIAVIQTPGHSTEHASLVANTIEGRYAIAGDVFWWEEGQAQKMDRGSLLELPDVYALDPHKLRESRAKLLQLADIIIPGHGKAFRVTN
jgi:glyoxylase-like metal-dependent hydrolase (beta-lactamase superfamily II)